MSNRGDLYGTHKGQQETTNNCDSHMNEYSCGSSQEEEVLPLQEEKEEADLPFTCVCCGDPTCRTYDRYYNRITDTGKTLLSKNDADIYDPCKFQIRVVTQTNCEGVEKDLFLDWIGVALGVHKNPEKEHRNWILGQKTDIIIERGQGSNDEVWDVPRTYPYEGADPAEYSWANGVRKPKCTPWNDDPDLASITYQVAHVGDQLQVRSPTNCCKWAIDWRPAVEETCIWIYVDESSEGVTEGVCGNNNGDPSDDGLGEWCDSDDCMEGDHDGQGFLGCRRV